MFKLYNKDQFVKSKRFKDTESSHLIGTDFILNFSCAQIHDPVSVTRIAFKDKLMGF